MRKPNNALLAQIEFICGSSGTGKSELIKQQLKTEKQVLVWDAKNEYGDLPGFRTTHRKDEFLKLARAGGRVAFAAPPSEFDFYTRVVWARGGCLNIVEELGAVTGTAKARDAWHLICSQGRGYGIKTIGIAQRVAEVDKTLIGNLSRLHVRRLAYEEDQVRMARLLGVPTERVAALIGYHWIERDMTAGIVTSSLDQVKGPPQKRPNGQGAVRNTKKR